ncbi:MAG: hypothetical protein AAGK01_05440, partial [Pseudomonadota bacterium]
MVFLSLSEVPRALARWLPLDQTYTDEDALESALFLRRRSNTPVAAAPNRNMPEGSGTGVPLSSQNPGLPMQNPEEVVT